MKNSILIFVMLLSISNLDAQIAISEFFLSDAEKEYYGDHPEYIPDFQFLDAGVGTSFRMGTLLFPSLDAYVALGSLEFEAYWKYSEWNQIPLHSFAGGVNIYLFKFFEENKFFVSYNYITNPDSEVLKDNEGNFIDQTAEEGHAFYIGVNGGRIFYMKLGIMKTPGLEDLYDPRLELGFRLPVSLLVKNKSK